MKKRNVELAAMAAKGVVSVAFVAAWYALFRASASSLSLATWVLAVLALPVGLSILMTVIDAAAQVEKVRGAA